MSRLTTEPWRGAARPLSDGAIGDAARLIGCAPEALEAVWEVESGGRCYLPDGSVIRRFEPHKMPGAKTSWRDSLRIGAAERERMFIDAYRRSSDAALRATSWGGSQVMGFNAEACGFVSAKAMVEAFADSSGSQVNGFVQFIIRADLAGALRSHDWLAFARGFNGSGQPEIYAARMESAYRRLTGRASPEVLRLGARGAAVRRLQSAIGAEADGAFGPETDIAVRQFQTANSLRVDGIVGAATWAALERTAQARPIKQAATADRMAGTVAKAASAAAAVTAAASGVRDVLPEPAYHALAYGAVGLALIAGAAFLTRYVRREVL